MSVREVKGKPVVLGLYKRRDQTLERRNEFISKAERVALKKTGAKVLHNTKALTITYSMCTRMYSVDHGARYTCNPKVDESLASHVQG